MGGLGVTSEVSYCDKETVSQMPKSMKDLSGWAIG